MVKEVVIEQEKVKYPKSKINKCIIIFIFVSLTIATSIHYFNKKYIYTNVMASNLFIEGINISGMTKEEANKKVSNKFTPKDIELSHSGTEYKILCDEINLNYNLDETIDNAFDYTKTDSYLTNLNRAFYLIKNKKGFSLKSSYNEEKLSLTLENISKKINNEVTDAKVYIDAYGSINVTPATEGKEVDLAANKEIIYKNIESKSSDKLELIVKNKEPKISTTSAKSVDTLLTQYSTKYSLHPVGRAVNIALSASSSSDILLMPGEEYSYNNLTGPRTKSNGYKDAGIIVNGKPEQGPGGGVCQTSTTLYNAVLFSGLKVTDTQNHSISSEYAPLGQDAMVSDGYSDLRFVNPYDHPVYIKNTVNNGTITSRVYGNSADVKNITIKVDRFNEGGLQAAKTYREYRNNKGEITKTEYISKSVYKKLT